MFEERLRNKAKIPKDIKNYLKALQPYKGGEWDLKDDEVEQFKEIVKRQLTHYQNGKCAYCELLLATRKPTIDHIAPKGGKVRPKYVDYTFLPINLVMACSDCNMPPCKGMTDTVETKGAHYTENEFTIVHPYLDDPQNFFSFIDSPTISFGVIPLVKEDATDDQKRKAKKTIETFKLDSEAKILERAKDKLYEESQKKQSPSINDLINSIVYYKGEMRNT